MRACLVSLAAGFLLQGCERTPSLRERAREELARLDGEVALPGLDAEVEVLRDEWGVPHIFAQNQEDLFFAQGYVQAQDRFWQMEHFRRLASGRYSEIVGPEAIAHDRLTRLLRYRGPFDDREWTSYHPETRAIATAFADGVNAFLLEGRLPVELRLTGIVPEPWTAEDVILRNRVGAAVDGAREELELAMAVAKHGLSEADRMNPRDPSLPLSLPEGLDPSLITEDVLRSLDGDLYGEFPRPELDATSSPDLGARETSPGSNNWAVHRSKTTTGSALMVDDPHRQVTLPAHRYIVHLVAPGWNVIGATEPGVPGVIRGHNGRVAWGRTATGSDQADVFVEELHPDDSGLVLYRGSWEPLEREEVEIAVKGEASRKLTIELSRHGPIFHKDLSKRRAYALRSYLMEPGTAEYLGGLRLDQAESARDCLTLADFLLMPPTNVVCADVLGNIAFRIAALSPRRAGGFLGRLPVPGTGRYEWDGFRLDLPSEYNPERGFIATANNNTQPAGYDPPLFFLEGPPYRRYERIAKVLSEDRRFGVEDMLALLRDDYSSEAAEDQALFHGWTGSTEETERAREMIAAWDCRMSKESAAAALYWTWHEAPEPRGSTEAALARAIRILEEQQGSDWTEWRWGRIHRTDFVHPWIAAFDVGSVERDGGAGTVNATGAVYRLVTDFSNLDGSMVTIGPGQSGQPESPYYRNLLDAWVKGEFFPLLYTRDAIEARTAHRLVLRPSP
jgi:penicillin amidase